MTELTDEEKKQYTVEELELLQHLVEEHNESLKTLGTNPNYWRHTYDTLHGKDIQNQEQ